MGKIISFFNHKGGVGKTTLVYNLGYALAQKLQESDKKVLLIDADSQMNLTSSVYGFANDTEYTPDVASKWNEMSASYLSIKDIFNASITNEACDPSKRYYPSKHSNNIHLLSGSLDLPSIESELLTFANTGGENIRKIFNRIENNIRNLLTEYEFIIVDTAPSANSIVNAILVMISDYFVAPVTPSFYSMQAIQNLTTIIGNWRTKMLDKVKHMPRGEVGISCDVKFLGICVQMVRPFAGKRNIKGISHAHYEWSGNINNSCNSFASSDKVDERVFEKIFPNQSPFVIQLCRDITPELRSISEKCGKPVICITQNDCDANKNSKSKKVTDITNPKNPNGRTNNHYAMKKAITDQINFIADGLLKL